MEENKVQKHVRLYPALCLEPASITASSKEDTSVQGGTVLFSVYHIFTLSTRYEPVTSPYYLLRSGIRSIYYRHGSDIIKGV